MELARCDKCGKAIHSGQGHYRIEGEGSYFCSDECLSVSFDESHGRGNWREDIPEEEPDCDGEADANEAGGYFSVFENGGWIPLDCYWTTMEEEEEEVEE